MIKAKRFWKTVEVKSENGFVIYLDQRKLMTPYNNPIIAPTLALAEAIAREWDLVEEEIVPEKMPMTKMINSALERVPNQRADIEAHLLNYLENDLLIYRASEPESLVLEEARWDPPLEWVQGFGIKLIPVKGIMAIDQAEANQPAAKGWLSRLSDCELVSFHEFVIITGSFVLAMAICEREMDASFAFELSRIDEDFQANSWGKIDEYWQERKYKLETIQIAEYFLKSSQKKE